MPIKLRPLCHFGQQGKRTAEGGRLRVAVFHLFHFRGLFGKQSRKRNTFTFEYKEKVFLDFQAFEKGTN